MECGGGIFLFIGRSIGFQLTGLLAEPNRAVIRFRFDANWLMKQDLKIVDISCDSNSMHFTRKPKPEGIERSVILTGAQHVQRELCVF